MSSCTKTLQNRNPQVADNARMERLTATRSKAVVLIRQARSCLEYCIASTKGSYPREFPRLLWSSSVAAEADDHSGRQRYVAAMKRRRELQDSRGLYHSSLVRTLTSEIRSLFCRIRELRRDQLDRRGVVIDPLYGTKAQPSVRRRAIDCCSEDMRSLCERRPHMTPVDFELFAEAWALGACWLSSNKDNEPLA